MEAQYEFASVKIYCAVVGPLDNNVYIVQCRESGESILIDAADEHERLGELCEILKVKSIVETHGHHDHIGAVAELRDLGLQVGVASQDAHLLPSYDNIISDGDIIPFGSTYLEVHHTPGHTPGSLCFSVPGVPVLFSGDTLFPGGPGATSYPGGDFPQIIASIQNRIFNTFAKETIVLPGHGKSTTIEAELPHLKEWIDRGW